MSQDSWWYLLARVAPPPPAVITTLLIFESHGAESEVTSTSVSEPLTATRIPNVVIPCSDREGSGRGYLRWRRRPRQRRRRTVPCRGTGTPYGSWRSADSPGSGGPPPPRRPARRRSAQPDGESPSRPACGHPQRRQRLCLVNRSGRRRRPVSPTGPGCPCFPG